MSTPPEVTRYDREMDLLTVNARIVAAKDAEIADLTQRLSAAEAEVSLCRKTMERIANLHDITTPLQLIAAADNDDETYADILVKVITKQRDALRKDAEREKARADSWREAATEVESFAPIYCEHLSHSKRTFHKSGEPCPVEKRIRDMFAAARAAEAGQ